MLSVGVVGGRAPRAPSPWSLGHVDPASYGRCTRGSPASFRRALVPARASCQPLVSLVYLRLLGTLCFSPFLFGRCCRLRTTYRVPGTVLDALPAVSVNSHGNSPYVEGESSDTVLC